VCAARQIKKLFKQEQRYLENPRGILASKLQLVEFDISFTRGQVK
jgi:hypothetical protein